MILPFLTHRCRMDHPLFTTTVKACDALLALSHALHLPRGNNLCACWTPTGVRFTTVDSQHRPHDLAQDTNLTAHALLARRTITQAATHALDRLGTCMSQDPILHDVLRNVEGQDQFQLLVNPAFSWPWFGLVLGGNAESRTMRLRIEHKPDALATRLIQAATPAHQGPRKRVVVWPRRWGGLHPILPRLFAHPHPRHRTRNA